jgi:hypothetical protein
MNKITETLDQAATKRTNSEGMAKLPAETRAPGPRSVAANSNTAGKQMLGKAVAVSDTRAFTLFLELINGGL